MYWYMYNVLLGWVAIVLVYHREQVNKYVSILAYDHVRLDSCLHEPLEGFRVLCNHSNSGK